MGTSFHAISPAGPPSKPTPSKSTLWISAAIVALGAVSLAQAQSNSPFASKSKKKAWETVTPSPTPVPQAPATSTAPSQTGYPSQAYPPAPRYTPPQPSRTSTQSQGVYIPPAKVPSRATTTFEPYAKQPYKGPLQGGGGTDAMAGAPTASGTYYPGREKPPAYYNPNYARPNYGGQNQAGQNYSAQNYPMAPGYNPGSAPQGHLPTPPAKRSWADKFGLGNLATSFSGFFKLGAAATDRDTQAENGWSEDFIADANIRGEVSAITQGGIEYGVGAELRAQYDKYRRGFGGRVGECPPGVATCASVDIGGMPTAIRGHSSQFYTSGPSNAKKSEIALEGAYVFLRSAYGDVTLGRDDGAAYLFSLGAPTLVAVGASNSPVDYTGLDAVKTVNDASGFAEKIAYVSPRLLGDQIGVGVQFGLSYAPDTKACGVDYCVRRNGADGTGVLSPDLEDVIEAGLSLDRKFGNGMRVEATATYATASEESGLAVFDDLAAYGLGLELGYMDWTVGASYLDSNNGLQDGDYTAYDVGLTWKPAAWGITAGYGHARDKNIDLTSDQAVLAFTYDIGKYRLGTGVQYIERTTPFAAGGVVTETKEKAGALFVEGSFRF